VAGELTPRDIERRDDIAGDGTGLEKLVVVILTGWDKEQGREQQEKWENQRTAERVPAVTGK
jgi:kynurenine formamidase